MDYKCRALPLSTLVLGMDYLQSMPPKPEHTCVRRANERVTPCVALSPLPLKPDILHFPTLFGLHPYLAVASAATQRTACPVAEKQNGDSGASNQKTGPRLSFAS